MVIHIPWWVSAPLEKNSFRGLARNIGIITTKKEKSSYMYCTVHAHVPELKSVWILATGCKRTSVAGGGLFPVFRLL